LTGTVNITDNNLNVEGVQQIPVSGAGVGVAATTLTASVNPQVQGLPVVFTAQVTPTPTNGPIPSGTVTFNEGATVLDSGTVNSAGIATFTTSSLSVGTHTITAVYSGDSNYQSSTSSPLTQTIVASLPETIEPVGGDDQAAVYGTAFAQPLSVVVTLSNGNPAAGVTVTFVGTGLTFSSGGAVTTNSSGMASVTATGAHAGGFVAAAMATGTPQAVNFALIVTPAPLTATANNATRPYGAANPAFTGTITGAVFGDTFSVSGSTTAVTSSPAGTYPITPIVTGTALANYTLTKVNGALTVTPVPLTATANNATRPFGAPDPVFTGTVTGAILGDTFSVSGSTTAIINSPPGTYPITPTVSGPTLTSYTVSKVNGILTVTKATSAVSLAVSPNPVVSGSQVTLTATVASGQTGTVTFLDGTTVLGTAAISGTMARLLIPTLVPALHTITADYNGDANFSPATSPPITLVVDVVILTPPPGPAEEGTPVTLTATVPLGATGTVTFYEGTTPIGTVTIPSVTGVTNTGITVTLVTTSLAPGTQTITAVFSGDMNFPPSTSPPISVVVTPPPPDFTVATSTGRQLIPPGASATYTIVVSSENGPFTNSVTMSATNLPPGATYTFSPAAVTPGAAGANTTFTVSVPPQSSMASRGRRLGPVAFALLLLPFACLKRYRRRPQRLLLWMLVALVSFGAVSGCGEGGYFSQTEQTYTITVTGTSGNLVHTTTVTLTVE
jgi:Bacterial Ig-like domain (group 3)/MBG domain (YGX type)